LVAGRSADAIRPANSTRHTDATTISPSTDSGSRYGDAPDSPYRAATPTMCQYDTHAAMPAISAVAASRTAARARRWTGTRLISSTVTSSATGGHAAIVWLIGFGCACSTFAATDAATPNARVARTAHRSRRRRRTGWARWVITGALLSVKINGVGWGPVARPPGWSADRDQVLHLLADLHRAPPVPLGQDLLVGLGDQDRLLGAVHLPQRLVDLVPGEGLVELDAQVGEGDPVAVAAALAGEDRLVGGGDLGGDLCLRHAYSIARYTVTVKHA